MSKINEFAKEKRATAISRKLVFGFVFAALLEHLFWVASWFVIGYGVVYGTIRLELLVLWILIISATVCVRMIIVVIAERLSTSLGLVVKNKTMAGCLTGALSGIEEQPLGSYLGKFLDLDSIERLSVNGGFQVVTAGAHILVASAVLLLGVSPTAHVLGLVIIISVLALLSKSLFLHCASSAEMRFECTTDFLENVLGQRTLRAQKGTGETHRTEDEKIASYYSQSKNSDRVSVRISLVPRLWLLLALIGMCPPFVFGFFDLGVLAISIGGTLLAYQALTRMAAGLEHLVGARVAWVNARRIAGLVVDSNRSVGGVVDSTTADERGGSTPVLTIKGVSFQYPTGVETILKDVSFRMHDGQKVLITGPSGSGKTTLASVMGGVFVPCSGVMLFRGYDANALGSEQWRNHVVLVPQFDQNHVMSASVAFNVLMGKGWPASESDLALAEKICGELGLGDLIDAMPGGMMERVGIGGWQLSHGEQCRLFIARALIQDPDILILDESFASLDSATVIRALDCVRKYSNSLVVIAHP